MTSINSLAKEKKKGFHKARATRFQKKPNLDRFTIRNYRQKILIFSFHLLTQVVSMFEF